MQCAIQDFGACYIKIFFKHVFYFDSFEYIYIYISFCTYTVLVRSF